MVETLKPDWVSGFTDGEGCFGIYAYRRGSQANGSPRRPQVSAEFSIQLREDDRAVLEALKAFFGCGRISENSREKARREGAPNAHDEVSFKVRDIESLVSRVIPHFDAFPLRSKKARDYGAWREGVMLLAQRAKLPLGLTYSAERAEILERVLGIASRVREGRNPGLRRSAADLVPAMRS